MYLHVADKMSPYFKLIWLVLNFVELILIGLSSEDPTGKHNVENKLFILFIF